MNDPSPTTGPVPIPVMNQPTISMYEASAPLFAGALRSLAAILDKAQAHAAARRFDPLVLASSRLFPDMFPLSSQVQIACDTAKGAAARLAGVEFPRMEDTEQTLAELKDRVLATVAFIESIEPAQLRDSEAKDIALRLGGRDVAFTGMQYLLGFAVPNFYFHVTTAFNILRHNGVEIGKRDYLGNLTL